MNPRRARLAVVAAVVISGPAIVAGLRTGHRLRPAPTLRVTFLDVGQGDATVIRTPGGGTFVVDAGRADQNRSRGRTVVLPYLRRYGVHALDALVLTHWDQDHAGGAEAVLSSMRCPRLILPVLPTRREPPTDTERRILAVAKRRRAAVWHLARGQAIRTGDGVTISVLNPPRRHRYRRNPDNNGSLVLMVSFGNRRVLLAGDAEDEAESNMVRSGLDLRCDVLKVGHHGSATGTTARWLDAVRPAWAVISVGRRNAFGHPNSQVLERLRRRGIRVVRTDRHGSVVVTSDGKSLDIHTNAR